MNLFTKQKDISSAETFCMAPYLSLYVDTTNDVRPCCISKLEGIKYDHTESVITFYNDKKLIDLRRDLSNGVKHASCNHCWNAEKVGMTSLRQGINERYENQFKKMRKDITSDYRVEKLDIKYLDIRFNNKCNLKCRTCSPQFSASWYSDHQKMYPKIPIEKKLDSDVTLESLEPILQTVTDIYFAGGEPLITDQHYEVLQWLIDNNRTNVNISYNTNFSKLTYKDHNVVDYWKKFKTVIVSASLDGNHKKGEYIRKNIDWEEVVKNRNVLMTDCPNVAFSISCTLSILNAYNIVELHKEWVELGFIKPQDFTVNLLFGPDWYNIKNLPIAHKEKLTALYTSHINWLKTFKDCDGVIVGYESAISLLAEKENLGWIMRWSNINDRLDKIRNEDFYEIFPEYKDL